MNQPITDPFIQICHRIEALSRLKEEGRISEETFQQIRQPLENELKSLSSLKESTSNSIETQETLLELKKVDLNGIDFGAIHSDGLRLFASVYQGIEEDEEKQSEKILNLLGERQLVSPTDSRRIREVIDIAYRTFGYELYTPSFIRAEVIKQLITINQINMNAKSDPTATPIGKAIVETSHQSAHEAANAIQAELTEAENHQRSVSGTSWKRLIGGDLKGCLAGSLAASQIGPALAVFLTPASIAAGVALGAAAGAIYGSAEEYKQYRNERPQAP